LLGPLQLLPVLPALLPALLLALPPPALLLLLVWLLLLRALELTAQLARPAQGSLLEHPSMLLRPAPRAQLYVQC
jgi:hypothetical protein